MDTNTNQEQIKTAMKEGYEMLRESDGQALTNLFFQEWRNQPIDNTIEALNKLKMQK